MWITVVKQKRRMRRKRREKMRRRKKMQRRRKESKTEKEKWKVYSIYYLICDFAIFGFLNSIGGT